MAASTANEAKLSGGYLVTPRVPQGLAAAVEGLTREVIRHSPEDIYVFAAHHFEKLLVLREQCGGVEKVSDRDSNLRALREMSQALKMREIDRRNVRSTVSSVDQVGWSLNQTAKVLKRHRSIFGETGRRISTDEVFRMANQKENDELPVGSSTGKSGSRARSSTKKNSSEERAENSRKTSTSTTERSWSNEDSAERNETNRSTRSGPRIITQIPGLQSSGPAMLARDIKTELRKNRISSRERRSVGAKPEESGKAIDGSETKAGKSTGKYGSSKKSDRQKRVEPEVDRKRSDIDPTRSSKDRGSNGAKGYRKNAGNLESRAMSIDRVKDSVVQRFATAKSLEELQSVNYVEKVQEIIDETGPIIKGKIDELKSGMIGRSKRSSWFAEARNDRARESNGSASGKFASSKESFQGPTTDALRSRLTETRCLLENISSSLTRPVRRSRSARSSRRARSGATTRGELSDLDARDAVLISDPPRDYLEASLSKTRNLLEDISSAISRPMRRSYSAKSLRKGEEVSTDDSSDFGPKGDGLRTRLDETRNLIAGLSASLAAPPRRIRSSRGSRNNVDPEELSNSDPQSVSKMSLPAVRSASVRSSSGSVSRSDSGNLVLPAISPEAPKSAKIKEDLVLPVLSPSGTASSNGDSKIGEATDVLLEELEIPEMPLQDYVQEAEVEDVFRDSLNVTPNFDGVPQRPDSLELDVTAEGVEEIEVDGVVVKHREIREADGDIQEIFESKNANDPESARNANMRTKLEELEEAERRIDRIFDREVSKDKNSPKSDRDVDEPVEIADESDDRGKMDGEEKRIERALPNVTERSDGAELESAVSPERLEYTYVLTEGSPLDIPDTVTTVIIPERTIQTPESSEVKIWTKDSPKRKLSSLAESASRRESVEEADVVDDLEVSKADDSDERVIDESPKNDRSNEEIVVQSKDSPEVKLSSLPENAMTKGSVKDVEDMVDDLIKDPKTDDSEKTAIEAKRIDRSNEEDSSARFELDLFGEFVKPEMTDSASTDAEFIREMENTRHNIKMSHQDLGRIKEEMSEELEGLDEALLNESESVGSIDGSKEEKMLKKTNEDQKDGAGNEPVVDESREKTESDMSPIASRPELDSVSSNEAKESSVLDEPLEMPKCAMSLEEEASSPTRSPESSNEVKETTLTDALSLSLDPMRPYVPELNLDSLQDLTVSSFKMTEDELENQGKAETGNTNSITDTLTSDENHRMIDSAEFAEEAIMEYLASSSGRSKPEETLEELANVREDVVEEPIVKSRVEIGEDDYEKIGTWVTGSSEEEEKLVTEEIKPSEEKEGEPEVVDHESKLPEVEQDTKALESSRSEDDEKEVVTDGKELSKAVAASEEEDDKVDLDLSMSPAQENSEPLGTKSIDKDSADSQSSSEAKAFEVATITVDRNTSEDESKKKAENSAEPENVDQYSEAAKKDSVENVPNEEEKNNVKSESPEIQNKEDKIKEEDVEKKEIEEEGIDSGSLNISVENADVSDAIVEAVSTDEVNSGDLEGASKSGEDGSDEILEENFVEEETPLAVSRSASQCTTRRVSSGNLARLREDPSLSWAEEVGPEATDEEDRISGKVKFSKIGGKTIREQGSDEIDQSQGSEEIKGIPNSDSSTKLGNEINASLAEDSKEYHIYVPDVDAGDDNSTTDSSTVESAVTKIQARVRGFLTRRRVHRGQHNRSSTLGSIPSIQYSVAVDPEGEERRDETGVSSTMASEDRGLESAATRIQSNYRRYRARNRLRREDAVQRTTLSVEKSFAESCLQHTGEFHDCVPLPIHDLPLRKTSSGPTAEAAFELASGSTTSASEIDKGIDSDSKSNADNSDVKEEIGSRKHSSENLHNVELLQTENLEEMFMGQSSKVPIMKFDLSPNLDQIVDLVVLAKEEVALQSGYLNFITSVEDADGVDVSPKVPMNLMGPIEGEGDSNESLKEPLALSLTPLGVVIEEVTSSGAENFMRSDDPEATMSSVGSSAAPEVVTESLDSPKAPCASSEGLSGSADSCEVGNNVSEETEVRQAETENFVVPEHFSIDQEKALLGPESSVDSMECPVASNEEKVSSESSGELTEKSGVTQRIEAPSVERELTCGPKEKNPKEEEPLLSNADESSSILSFSMKVQDFLGLGSEDSTELHGRKPILEVTLSPGDLMKSMSTSQDSQLAGERIESPITMVQMAPGSSGPVQQEDSSDNADEETNGKRTLGSSSEKSEKT